MAEDCNLFIRLSKLGRIEYLSDFEVRHSPRRFRQYGYPRTFLLYGREFVSLSVRNRSHLARWEPVR